MFIRIQQLYNIQRPQHHLNVFFLYVRIRWSYETILQTYTMPRNK